MIRYHGGPCTPIEAALELWSRRHALISFAYPQQVDLALRVAHSVRFDNGAFSAWEDGREVDWEEYGKWIADYWRHPGFDGCFIPDVIDGDEKATVAIGSSGEFQQPGTLRWWNQMSSAMAVVCDTEGIPRCNLHGLRQMDTTIFSHVPYSGVDSARVSRSIGIDKSVPKAYRHLPVKARAMVMAWDADMHISAARWTGSIMSQKNLEMS